MAYMKEVLCRSCVTSFCVEYHLPIQSEVKGNSIEIKEILAYKLCSKED